MASPDPRFRTFFGILTSRRGRHRAHPDPQLERPRSSARRRRRGLHRTCRAGARATGDTRLRCSPRRWRGARPGKFVDGFDVVRRGGRLGVYREARRFWNARATRTIRRRRRRDQHASVHHAALDRRHADRRADPSARTRDLVLRDAVSDLGPRPLRPRALVAPRLPARACTHGLREQRTIARRPPRLADVVVLPEGWTPHRGPDVAKEAVPTVVFLGRLVAMKRPEDALARFRPSLRRLLPGGAHVGHRGRAARGTSSLHGTGRRPSRSSAASTRASSENGWHEPTSSSRLRCGKVGGST